MEFCCDLTSGSRPLWAAWHVACTAPRICRVAAIDRQEGHAIRSILQAEITQDHDYPHQPANRHQLSGRLSTSLFVEWADWPARTKNSVHRRLAIVNGFAGMHPEDRVESFARAPYPLGGDVKLGGVWLSQAQQQVTFLEQRYDFSCGELTKRLRYMVDGQTLQLEILTFCSRSLPTVIAQEVRASCSNDSEISLRSVIDPVGIPGKQLVREKWLVTTSSKPRVALCPTQSRQSCCIFAI